MSAATDSTRLAAWQRLLPDGIRVSAGRLPAREARAAITLPSSTASRNQEFQTGRYHAARALAALGVESEGLTAAEPGQGPRWPHGVAGSITHTATASDSHVAAAATDQWTGVGIDAEFGTPEPATWGFFMRPDDWGPGGSTCAASPLQVARWSWALKESACKAAGAFSDMTAWCIVPDRNAGDFGPTCVSLTADGCAHTLRGAVLEVGDLVLAAAWYR